MTSEPSLPETPIPSSPPIPTSLPSSSGPPLTTTPTATTEPAGLSTADYLKWGAAAAIMASIFLIDYFGVKAPDYLPVALSALTALGVHSAAKNLT
jgi:hypothetical protein